MICQVCKSATNSSLYTDTIDRITQENFKVLKCSKCQLIWTETTPNLDLGRYYPAHYYGTESRRFLSIIELLVRMFRKHRADFVEKWVKNSKKTVLDIGCGRGLMLSYLAKNGWGCFGTEFSNTSAHLAQKDRSLTIKVVQNISDCGFESTYFGVVTLWHVFEHLSDIPKATKELNRILVKGGVLIIEVPNIRSWQARLDKKHWIYLEAPRHLFHFSKNTLASILEKNSFEIKYSSTKSVEFGWFGMVQALLNRCLPSKNFLYGILQPGMWNLNKIISLGFLTNFILLILLIIPCLILGLVLETLAITVGAGSVVRVLAIKSL